MQQPPASLTLCNAPPSPECSAAADPLFFSDEDQHVSLGVFRFARFCYARLIGVHAVWVYHPWPPETTDPAALVLDTWHSLLLLNPKLRPHSLSCAFDWSPFFASAAHGTHDFAPLHDHLFKTVVLCYTLIHTFNLPSAPVPCSSRRTSPCRTVYLLQAEELPSHFRRLVALFPAAQGALHPA